MIAALAQFAPDTRNDNLAPTNLLARRLFAA